jgi:hypothetical protein
MSSLQINTLQEDKILSGYNFAKKSDIIFSEILTHEQYSKIMDKTYLEIVSTNNDSIFYINKNMNIKENDIIFSTTDFVNELFLLLGSVKELKNLKLITHQSDIAISKKMFSTKPDCISEWYSTNVNYEHKNLHSLPIGISNNPVKNPLKKDFEKIKINNNKELSMYINFQINTNIRERKKIYKIFSNKSWVKIDNPNQSLFNYLKKLSKYNFILAPWGNGYDTHRFWEAIYAGSIPITRDHLAYRSAKNLPVLFIDRYEEITKNTLQLYLDQYHAKQFNFKKMTVDFWMEKISTNINHTLKESKEIHLKDEEAKLFIEKYHSKKKTESKRKKIMFRLRQLSKIIRLEFLR